MKQDMLMKEIYYGDITHESWGFFYFSWKFLDQRLPPIQSIRPL